MKDDPEATGSNQGAYLSEQYINFSNTIIFEKYGPI